MENHKLQPLTEAEKKQAEESHNLLYSFLHRHGYSIEAYYNIAIFGYLKGIQIYNRREDLRNKYKLAFICEQYMRSEVGNHFKMENAQKRKPAENIISLDAEYTETENLYNCVPGNSADPVSEIIEAELLAELLENLTGSQRKIAEMRMDGYKNKEIYLLLEIKPSTYYKEMQRIKAVLANLIN